MKCVLAILVDAFRYDYLSEEDTPFLYRLSQEGYCAPLKTILGYSDSIRAAIFTGTYPDDNGYWMGYRYNPETSPFKDYARFGFIEHFPGSWRPFFKLGISKLMRQASIHNLPPRIAPLFDKTMAQNSLELGAFGDIPSVFDVIHDGGLKSAYIGSDNLGMLRFWFTNLSKGPILKQLGEVDPDTQLIFLYLHFLDNGGHRYGVNSRRFRNELREVDSLLKQSIAKVSTAYDDLEIMIFSDHGMADAREFIDFEKLNKHSGFGKDFFFVTDSTMLRVWYQNENRRGAVRAMIEDTGYGRFLAEEEKKQLHLDFKNRYYGDDIYLIDPPLNIFPNSTSLLKPHGMHAYHPDLQSQVGIAIFRGAVLDAARSAGEYVKIVDFMPTILSVLGLSIPATCRGTSLV